MSDLKVHKIRLYDELWNKFSEICGAEGTNCSEKIRELIKMYINSQNDNSLDEIYDLIDRIVQRSGHISVECIQRNTTTGQEPEVLEYCKQKSYPIVSEKWYEIGRKHKFEW